MINVIISSMVIFCIIFENACCSDASKNDRKECKNSKKQSELTQNSIPNVDISKITYSQLQNDRKLLKTVFTLIEGGNEEALRLQFRVRPYFVDNIEVSELFDVYAGKAINKNPMSFLTLLNEYWKNPQESGFDLSSILGNYGEKYVDNFNEQVIETETRIQSLKKVNDNNIIIIRDKCIQILQGHKKELENIINEINTDSVKRN